MNMAEAVETIRTAYDKSFGPEEPKEPLKAKLENTAEILNELKNQLSMIEDAFIGPNTIHNERANNATPADTNILMTVNDLRDTAERLLKTAVRIREVLW